MTKKFLPHLHLHRMDHSAQSSARIGKRNIGMYWKVQAPSTCSESWQNIHCRWSTKHIWSAIKWRNRITGVGWGIPMLFFFRWTMLILNFVLLFKINILFLGLKQPIYFSGSKPESYHGIEKCKSALGSLKKRTILSWKSSKAKNMRENCFSYICRL